MKKNPKNGDFEVDNIQISTLPFKVYAENAGAWLSIAVGNFDGDEYNTQEIAIYRPYNDDERASVEIFRLEEENYQKTQSIRDRTGKYITTGLTNRSPSGFKQYNLVSVGSLDLTSKSDYYFYKNTFMTSDRFLGTNFKARDWKYQYRFPALNLEVVKQPRDKSDDLCITFTAALGGKISKDSVITDINATHPYDSATGVLFWTDPLTEQQKSSSPQYMRFNWKNDYKISENTDKDAAKKYEVMVFGGAGAGDINNDSYQEVVIGGYLIKNREKTRDGSAKSDWNISKDEYLSTYFTYNPDQKTYSRVKQCPNWVSIKKSDYENASALGEGIYSNYGEKDMVHSPLAVTCFSERGTGYGESVAIGGIVCLLDEKSGVSERTPNAKNGMSSYFFNYGAFNPRYAIPTEKIHKDFGAGIQNRLITESTAGNFDGNTLGQEQLAFSYVGKVKEKSQWSSAYGIIGQSITGEPDHVYNVDDSGKNYLGDDIRFSFWIAKLNETHGASASICAADTDNDSTIIRYSGKPNEYFFSNPRILAALQATPYFHELDYVDAGATSIEFTEGSSSETEHGLSVGAQFMSGTKISLFDKISVIATVGFSSEFQRTWGKGSSDSYSLEYSAGKKIPSHWL